MESKLKDLSLAPTKSQPSHHPTKPTPQKPIAESWEDASSGSDTDVGDGPLSNKKSPGTDAPPPTPCSPSFPTGDIFARQGVFLADERQGNAGGGGQQQGMGKRPEKSVGAAGRMIAAGLGVRAPKKTEEQRAYEKAARENEVRKRNRERELREKEREADEKAKAAMWDS